MTILTVVKEIEYIPTILEQIATTRWNHQVAGIMWNDLFVDTSTDSYNLIMGASYGVQQGYRTDGAIWKFGNPLTGQPVYRPTTNAEMIEVSKLVYNYVQSCFDRESELYAASREPNFDPTTIDIGWP